MGNSIVIWALVVAFFIFFFVGFYLLEMNKEADQYISLKKSSREPLKGKMDRLVKKLSTEQLKTLINVLKN